MSRGRKCKKLDWLWTDSTFVATHKNNLRVFNKIRRMRKLGTEPSVDRIIGWLCASPVWGERMRGKKRSSWKAAYFRWEGGVVVSG